MSLSEILRRLRNARGLSVDQVSDKTGFARSTIYFWEQAHNRGRPMPEQLGALLDLYMASDAERSSVWEARAHLNVAAAA